MRSRIKVTLDPATSLKPIEAVHGRNNRYHRYALWTTNCNPANWQKQAKSSFMAMPVRLWKKLYNN
jgi:hypothetical protein